MSLWSRIRGWFGSESAQTRPTGGVADTDAPDTHSTTGTTPNESFVGRVGGDDPGEVEAPGKHRGDGDRPHKPEGQSSDEDTDPTDGATGPNEETRRAQEDDTASGGS